MCYHAGFQNNRHPSSAERFFVTASSNIQEEHYCAVLGQWFFTHHENIRTLTQRIRNRHVGSTIQRCDKLILGFITCISHDIIGDQCPPGTQTGADLRPFACTRVAQKLYKLNPCLYQPECLWQIAHSLHRPVSRSCPTGAR